MYNDGIHLTWPASIREAAMRFMTASTAEIINPHCALAREEMSDESRVD